MNYIISIITIYFFFRIEELESHSVKCSSGNASKSNGTRPKSYVAFDLIGEGRKMKILCICAFGCPSLNFSKNTIKDYLKEGKISKPIKMRIPNDWNFIMYSNYATPSLGNDCSLLYPHLHQLEFHKVFLNSFSCKRSWFGFMRLNFES